LTDIRLHRLGSEKLKVFEKNFDKVFDWYRDKANQSGYFGDLKFIKERGKMIIYVTIELPLIDENNEE
jgi:hypothetical protein